MDTRAIVLSSHDTYPQAALQRLISLTLSKPSEAIPALLKYLDIFYTDPAGWSLLAELYADLGLYAQSLTALEHVMLMQAWDSAVVRRAAETAYTMGCACSAGDFALLADLQTCRDYALALKFFLRCIELEANPPRPEESGGSRKNRSWWGVKLVISSFLRLGKANIYTLQTVRRLMDQTRVSSDSVVPSDMATTPVQLKALDALATERLLAVGGAGLPLRRIVLGDISVNAKR